MAESYIIMASAGAYSDHVYWPVAVAAEKRLADAWCIILADLLKGAIEWLDADHDRLIEYVFADQLHKADCQPLRELLALDRNLAEHSWALTLKQEDALTYAVVTVPTIEDPS